jgi:methyl-accepting chemotaxis protein
MADKEKVTGIIEEAKEIVELAEEVVDGANEVADAAEDVGKKAGGLFTRIKNMILSIITYFKNLFKKG